jgi:DNA-binding response OmpR family regulator
LDEQILIWILPVIHLPFILTVYNISKDLVTFWGSSGAPEADDEGGRVLPRKVLAALERVGRMSPKLLVIDDDLGLLTLLKRGLELEGFTVVTAESGKDGFDKAYDTRPDVILLDIVLPQYDGWIVFQQLRRICETPIIIFSAKASTQDIAKGKSLGVADYITKPCGFRELKARIHQVLMQGSRQDSHVVYDDGYLCIDPMNGLGILRKRRVEFSPTEARLLTYLARRKGQVVPYRELLVQVWGPEYEQEVDYLNTYVRYLRQKIEADPAHPHYIRSHLQEGYCFAGETA